MKCCLDLVFPLKRRATSGLVFPLKRRVTSGLVFPLKRRVTSGRAGGASSDHLTG